VSASVVLVGFMGAGKTTIGQSVARRLGLPLIDTDALIEQEHGTIAQLFADGGEARFRELEREVVLRELDVAVREDRVLALGGGAVTIDDVREALTRIPHVVWHDAPPDVLFRRSQSGARPLARDAALFEALHAQRIPLYREVATAVVRGSGRERPDWMARRVLAAVGR